MAALSRFVCAKGHQAWAPRKLTKCPTGRCTEPVECVAGPLKPKAK